jgi:nitrite reductase (NADH) small subunit
MTAADAPISVPRPAALDANGIAVIEAGGREIVVLRQGDDLRAIDRWCPHEDGDLAEGMMFGKNIKCPVHGFIFDLTKGQCLNHFSLVTRVYTVSVVGADLVLTEVVKPTGQAG